MIQEALTQNQFGKCLQPIIYVVMIQYQSLSAMLNYLCTYYKSLGVTSSAYKKPSQNSLVEWFVCTSILKTSSNKQLRRQHCYCKKLHDYFRKEFGIVQYDCNHIQSNGFKKVNHQLSLWKQSIIQEINQSCKLEYLRKMTNDHRFYVSLQQI